MLDPENQTLSDLFSELKPESVIEVSGEVRNRDESTANANLDTGEIELFAQSIIVHNQSERHLSRWMTPPTRLARTSG